MNRYRGVSGWAAPYVDEETGEVDPPIKNVTPGKQPLFLWLASRQAQSRARMAVHAKEAKRHGIRTAVALALAFMHLHIVSGLAGVLACVFGALFVWNAELWLVGKREIGIPLDED